MNEKIECLEYVVSKDKVTIIRFKYSDKQLDGRNRTIDILEKKCNEVTHLDNITAEILDFDNCNILVSFGENTNIVITSKKNKSKKK